MSIWGKRIPVERVAIVAVVFVVIAGVASVMTKPRPREVTLVAKDMVFYVEGDLENPNPTIEAKAGETLRVILRNQDRGITHDFAVPAFKNTATEMLDWNEEAAVTFEVPDEPGAYEYVCQPHVLMMKGLIEVRD
jgi:plastocyanin